MVVLGKYLGHPGAIGDLQHVLPAVGVVFVGAEQAEVPRVQVQLHDVAQERAHHARRLGRRRAGRWHVDGVVAEIGQLQVAQQQRRRWRADWRSSGASPLGASSASSGRSRPLVVEQLLGPIALHPLLEDADVLGFSCISPIGTWCERQ